MAKRYWSVRWGFRLCCGVVALAVCGAAPAADEAAEAASPEVVVERDVAVPMRDGTILRADVWRPDGGGPYPVLVWRTPYGKHAKKFDRHVRAGYIVVCQDARGRYASEGQFESMVREETHDGTDGYDTVEWAARLPGSTGHEPHLQRVPAGAPHPPRHHQFRLSEL